MRNKIGTMFLASAVALAFIGGSYAMWSETIVMSGTVNTGKVDIAWSLHGCGDTDDLNPDPLKDVSEIEAVINDAGVLVITITNAYPCIDYWVWFDVTNVGTVPVHFAVETNPPELFASGVITIDNIVGTQLHTGESWDGYLHFHMTNLLWDTVLSQDPLYWVQGGGPYSFTVTIHGFQYNEDWPPAP
jgi:predicted ribosomally synthesized peptide with SipW-like signal peptide